MRASISSALYWCPVRAESHVNHAAALRTLQLPHRLVLVLLRLHREQLALAHRAESHLLAAVRARDAPVGAGERTPLLRMALLGNTPSDKLVRTSLYRTLRVLYTSGSMVSKGIALYGSLCSVLFTKVL